MLLWCSEQAEEASEEEVGCGDEEDTRNMEDDSINLMLEDEEKMLEDELTFNEPDRHEQVRASGGVAAGSLVMASVFFYLGILVS